VPARDAENLILCHQVVVLQRQAKAPKLSWAHRAVLAALTRLLPGGQLRQLHMLVSPRTLLRWHADLVQRQARGPDVSHQDLIDDLGEQLIGSL
jgi:putative transposase